MNNDSHLLFSLILSSTQQILIVIYHFISHLSDNGMISSVHPKDSPTSCSSSTYQDTPLESWWEETGITHLIVALQKSFSNNHKHSSKHEGWKATGKMRIMKVTSWDNNHLWKSRAFCARVGGLFVICSEIEFFMIYKTHLRNWIIKIIRF